MPPQPVPISSRWCSGPSASRSQSSRYLCCCASASDCSGRLEDRARVGHRRVEPELEERVREVVVRLHVLPRRVQAVRQARSRDQAADACERAERALAGDRRVVVGEQLEQAHQVGRLPLAAPGSPRRARAAAMRASRRRNAQSSTSSRAGSPSPAAVAAPRPVGQDELEPPAADAPQDRVDGAQRERRHAIGAVPASGSCGDRALTPGTYGGLRWYGTRFAARRSACSRISALTWNVISGRRASTRASECPSSSTRRAASTAWKKRSPPRSSSIRTDMSSPGSASSSKR